MAEIFYFKHALPKHKRMIISKNVLEKLKAKDGEFIYLHALGYKHPVVLCQNGVTISLLLRKLIEGREAIKFGVERIEKNTVCFLSRLLPHKRKGRRSFNLHIHKLGRRSKILRIEVNQKGFFGRVERYYVEVGNRIANALGLKPFKMYQFTVSPTKMHDTNNDHLFSHDFVIDYEGYIQDNYIILNKLLQDFHREKLGNLLEVYYSNKHADSKKIKIKGMVRISEELAHLLGLFKADGAKNTRYFCFSNTDIRLVKYFIDRVSKIFGISRVLFLIEVRKGKNVTMSNDEIKSVLSDYLGIKKERILVYSGKEGKSEVSARIYNKTINKIMIRILSLAQRYALINKVFCRHFLSGVLAGDGYLCFENEKFKRIELYFDPNKVRNEGVFYINCLKRIGLRKFAVRLYYSSKEDKIRAQKIAKKLERVFSDIKCLHKKKLLGIGGTIFIYKGESRKFALYNLFYPKRNYAEKFTGF